MLRFLIPGVLFLAGCASPGLVPPGARPSLADAQAAAVSPRVTEAAGGGLLNAAGGPYSHQPVEGLVQETLDDLLKAAGQDFLPRRVIILNSPDYNAHALPNGQIFVTRGLLALANDQAELAAAMAHELGHVIARHAAQRIVARANHVADTMQIARVYQDPGLVRAEAQERKKSLAAFSRSQEIEADRIGVELLAKAGYDPRAALRMIAGLERLSSFQLKRARIEPSAERLALASHPPAPERLAALRAAVAKSSAVQGKTGRERYVAALSGMAFGEDGRSGFVRGRTFMHPALDIAMTLPQGYILRGARASVTALSEGGKTAVLFTRLPAQAAGDPEGALRRMLASVSSSAEFSQLPGGLNGASALTRKDKAAVRTVVFETGGKPYRMVFATKEHSPAFDRDAAAVLASVRALTGGDQRLARPLTLRIERGASASALRQLAERAGNADHGAELILALNGLKSPSELRPGLALKVPELTAE